MRNTLCINIECDNTLESYSTVSCILQKLSQKTKLSESDLNCITYFPSANIDIKENLTYLSENFYRVDRIEIKKPDVFINTIYDYELGIILHITYSEGGMSDITGLINMLLIKHFYDSFNINIVISGQKASYYKISQYMALTSQDNTMYNCIYFCNGNQSKKLQRNGIGALHDYIPAIYIKNDEFIQKKYSHNSEGALGTNEDNKTNGKFDLYAGCEANINALCKEMDTLHITSKDITAFFDNKTLFSCLLFGYTINGANYKGISTKEDFLKVLRNYSDRMEQYASCVKQLVENVLFHSAKKEGMLSVRCFFGDRHKLYLEKMYGEEYFKRNDKIASFCEIIISDYSGNIDNGNIAENFCRSLDEKYKEQFKNLKPAGFFTILDEESAKAWSEYYSEEKNFASHYGLKIFKSLVERCGGIFHMETHSSHCGSEDEHYTTVSDGSLPRSKKVLPGTSYRILLPNDLTTESAVKSIPDVSIMSNLTESWSKYLKWKAEDIDLSVSYTGIDSPDKKGELIFHIIKVLSEQVGNKSSSNSIFQCDAANYDAGAAEIICKAILIFLRDNSEACLTNFIFYNCKDQAFRTSFIETLNAFWDKEVSAAVNPLCQIALFNEDNSRFTVLTPNSRRQTALLNAYISKARAMNPEFDFNCDTSEDKLNVDIIPFDVICTPSGGKSTAFEQYVQKILTNNVQGEELGCKIQDTHMRLGSSIHIDDFYEAEILFSNKLFVSGFSYLLVKKIMGSGKNNSIILYGYASYSEMLLYNVKYLLASVGINNVECMFLEREAEHRGIGHMDIIRKNISDDTLKNSAIYFIVPINSTMKTLSKMYDTLDSILKALNRNTESSNDSKSNAEKKYKAFAVITVVSRNESKYWAVDNDGSITLKNNFLPHFEVIDCFVTVKTNYYEAAECELCYPTNLLHEKPLIEVNASSTIPYQSFKLLKCNNNTWSGIDKGEFENQVRVAERLRSSLVYGHTRRGENHFWYYIRTEIFMQDNRIDIEEWLKTEVKNITTDNQERNEFNIIFCPMHFSNVDFMEAVNNYVFSGAAMVIRVDVDKEYRSNFTAKFSNISRLMSNLESGGEDYLIRFHYVDDTIITGRTFNRAKSLAKSLFKIPTDKIRIFDTIIVLLNRNSADSTRLFVSHFGDAETKVYSFVNLCISSLRTHGNSCVLCNLATDAKRLEKYSSTQIMADYWSDRAKNGFGVKDIRISDSYNQSDRNDKASDKNYRRLLCSHIMGYFLAELNAYSGKQEAMKAIIKIITVHLKHLEDQESPEEERRELFYSYLKVLTRPFIYFDKFVREAAFDLLLVLIESLLNKNDIEASFELMFKQNEKGISCKKTDQDAPKKVKEMLELACIDFSKYDPHLLKILMKQLTEMKSNYIIRCSGMNKIIKYICDNCKNEGDLDDFIMYYVRIAKRLICVSSDTSKSVWLDHLLFNKQEKEDKQKEHLLDDKYMNKLVAFLFLENTKVYYDAIEHLSTMAEFDVQTYNGNTYVSSALDTTYVKSTLDKIDKFNSTNPSIEEIRDFIKGLGSNSVINNCITSLSVSANNQDEKAKLKTIYDWLSLFDIKADNNNSSQQSKEFLEKIMTSESFVFANFRKIYDMLVGKSDQEANEDQANKVYEMIRAAVLLLRHINNAFSSGNFADLSENKQATSMNVNKQFNTLALLIKELLGSMSASIIFKAKSDVNAWENELAEAMKNKPKTEEKSGGSISDIFSNSPDTSEFIVLSSSEAVEDGFGNDNVFYPLELRKNMSDYDKNRGKMDYYASENYFIWEIAMDKLFPVYIYAEFSENDDLRDFRIKFLMMMRHKLCQKIFGRDVNQYLHELVKERNELIFQRREKTHTHTIHDKQWYYYQASTQQNVNSSLILLSDLAVSEAFRQSLTREYYIPYSTLPCYKVIEWKECYSGSGKLELNFAPSKAVKLILSDKVSGDGGSDSTEDVISSDDKWLDDNDLLIQPDHAENYHKHFLFLVALAQNSIKNIHEPGRVMNVYIKKTQDGFVRLYHKANDSVNDEQITQITASMAEPPTTRDSGITLWSVASFIRAIRVHVAFSYIRSNDKIDMKLLRRLFSVEYDPKVEVLKYNNNAYLSIKLPILKSKYNDFLKKGES